jgi:hypothetical protein
MKSMSAVEPVSSGAAEMSRFHQLSAGNTARPEKSSSSTTLSAGLGPGPDAGVVGGEPVEQPASIVSVPAQKSTRTPPGHFTTHLLGAARRYFFALPASGGIQRM